MGLPELMERFLLEIYRMPMVGLAVLAGFAVLLFCALFRKYAAQRWLRPCIGAMLAAWFAVVLWITVLSRSGSGVYPSSWIPLHTYWLAFSGGNPELLRSAYMNAVLFFPAGLLLSSLLPEKWSIRNGMLCTGLLFALFSLVIELSQYHFRLGNAEFDDILHNTLGAAAGFAAFRIRWSGSQDTEV